MNQTYQKSHLRLFAAIFGLSLAVASYGLLVNPAWAQNTGNYDTTGSSGLVQCGNKSGDPCTVEDVFNIFVIATNLLVGAVGLVAILAIVYSGFSMVTAAGNTESITKAKKHLTAAITGLVLVFLAFVLINVVIYGLLGATGNKGDIFNPLQYFGLVNGGNNSIASPSANSQSNVPATNSTGK